MVHLRLKSFSMTGLDWTRQAVPQSSNEAEQVEQLYNNAYQLTYLHEHCTKLCAHAVLYDGRNAS
jgi:hypothetical protein